MQLHLSLASYSVLENNAWYTLLAHVQEHCENYIYGKGSVNVSVKRAHGPGNEATFRCYAV